MYTIAFFAISSFIIGFLFKTILVYKIKKHYEMDDVLNKKIPLKELFDKNIISNKEYIVYRTANIYEKLSVVIIALISIGHFLKLWNMFLF